MPEFVGFLGSLPSQVPLMEYCVVLFSYRYSPGQVSEYSPVPFALGFQSEASQEGPLALSTASLPAQSESLKWLLASALSVEKRIFLASLSVWPLQQPFFDVHT